MKQVDRIQTGVRIERRIVKVMKALAERLDMSLGELIEGVMLHTFEGKTPFGPETLARIEQLRQVYDLDLVAADSHQLIDSDGKAP